MHRIYDDTEQPAYKEILQLTNIKICLETKYVVTDVRGWQRDSLDFFL